MLFPLLLAAALAAVPDDVSAITALRRDYNTAVAARDFTALRGVFDPDYHVIRGASGAMLAGPLATEGLIRQDMAKDPGFVTYERTIERVEIGTGGQRAAEHGRWEGRWREVDGMMSLTGVYLAMWVKTGGRWNVKSEAFVALKCSGSAECRRFTL